MIDEIVVDSANQGKGIGKKLMKFAQKYFKGVTSVDLWIFKLAKAYKFYKNLGYKDHEKGVMRYKRLK
jgi:GNAT superfamily N-acetyltransferase